MKDLEPVIRILSMDIIWNRWKDILKLSQETYLKQVLKAFNMEDSRVVVTHVIHSSGLRGVFN